MEEAQREVSIGGEIDHHGREHRIHHIDRRVEDLVELVRGARSNEFCGTESRQKKPVHSEGGPAKLLVVANIGNAGQNLDDAAEDQGDDQCAHPIAVRDPAELSDSKSERPDGEPEQSDGKYVYASRLIFRRHRILHLSPRVGACAHGRALAARQDAKIPYELQGA